MAASQPLPYLSPTPHQAVRCKEVEARCVVEEVGAAGAIEVSKTRGLVCKESLPGSFRGRGRRQGIQHPP